MKTILKFILLIFLIFISIFSIKIEYFYQNRKIYSQHSGGNNCNYISTNINNKNYACCTAFNNEKKYGNKCCIKVDKNHNCQSWEGSY